MSHRNVADTGDAMSTTIAAHYKTRFHREVIFTSLAFNPELAVATVKDAVEANVPAKFLPKPWPPVSADDVKTLKTLTLTKMKHTVCIRTDLELPHTLVI